MTYDSHKKLSEKVTRIISYKVDRVQVKLGSFSADNFCKIESYHFPGVMKYERTNFEKLICQTI